MGLGAIAGGIAGSLGMKFIEREWAKDDASTARHWQEGMSNTAHQREVADLKAAGLNPMLSLRYGGASTGTPAMERPTTFENPATAVQQIRLAKAQANQLKSQKDLNRAAELKTANDARISSANARKAEVEAKKAEVDYERTYARSRTDSNVAGEVSDYPSWVRGPVRTVTQYVAEKIKSGKSKAVSASQRKREQDIVDRLNKSKTNWKAARKVGSNKKKADSYREFLKKNPNYRRKRK